MGLDMFRSAQVLVKHHGKAEPIKATMRPAEALRRKGPGGQAP